MIWLSDSQKENALSQRVIESPRNSIRRRLEQWWKACDPIVDVVGKNVKLLKLEQNAKQYDEIVSITNDSG